MLVNFPILDKCYSSPVILYPSASSLYFILFYSFGQDTNAKAGKVNEEVANRFSQRVHLSRAFRWVSCKKQRKKSVFVEYYLLLQAQLTI
jgi:hypothetical protein